MQKRKLGLYVGCMILSWHGMWREDWGDEEVGVLRREGVGKVIFEVGLTGALRDLTLGW
ncbi:hypothetical protein [Bartonella sp. AP11XZML]|uniref:hypothetical protein n=1 Tax=Bartonella sp. AP11XZML TaxID=3243465 RepID=UPI0035CF1177